MYTIQAYCNRDLYICNAVIYTLFVSSEIFISVVLLLVKFNHACILLTIDKLHVVDEHMCIHVNQSAVLVNLL